MDRAPFIAFQPGGRATGIGSLPYSDPRSALAMIEAYLPDMPHWPQLPQRGSREHFCHQFLQPLVECRLLRTEENRYHFDSTPQTLADRLTDFYERCLPAQAGDAQWLARFMPPTDSAVGLYDFIEAFRSGRLKPSGYVKGQIVGPLTVGLALNDSQGRPAYYHGDLRDALVRTLSLAARCQTAALRRTGAIPILLVDDPAISAWGSRLHLALDRETIQADLEAIFDSIESEGGLCGLHACQAIDWSIVLSTGIRILSLDAYRYGESLIPHAQRLGRFMEKGGVVAWGIVPTLDDPFAVTVDILSHRLEALWNRLFVGGPDRATLVRQSLVTPACGVGLLPRDQAERIYRLTSGLSRRLRGMEADPDGSTANQRRASR